MHWWELHSIVIHSKNPRAGANRLETNVCLGSEVLSNENALPVPMLRQVSLQGSRMMTNHSVFEVFRCLGLSRSVLRLCTLSYFVLGALWSVLRRF